MRLKYVVVSGFVSTGSSAVIDLLKEYESFVSSDVEFRLIKDPYGLIDLRHAIIDRWDPLNVDAAIKDFLWLAKHLNKKRNRLTLTNGLGYGDEKALGKKFMKATIDFVNSITDFQYDGTWFFLDFKLSKIQYLGAKIRRKIGRPEKDKMYFSCCDENTFDSAVRNYLDDIFQYKRSTKRNATILLDQAFPAQNIFLFDNFLPESKMIIVDRDPRDVYINMINQDFLLKNELAKHKPEVFIAWYKEYHKNIEKMRNDGRILLVNFEDIVLNYEKEKHRIELFLGIDPSSHILRESFLKPELSKKNIGLYTKYKYQDEIALIEEKLASFLWKGGN